eukprot:Tamp_17863.p1 GENE.Tamp_17863~~Tamp_17863.p1  ORF type:complete len:328 (+),score=64.13 Tamp_17863:86-985(+)
MPRAVFGEVCVGAPALHAAARWHSAGAGKGKGKKGKKDKKDKGAAAATAADKLYQTLMREVQLVNETPTPPLQPPTGWERVNVDEYVNRGDEGIIVLRKKYRSHRVDLVASNQLIQEEEDTLDLDEPLDQDDTGSGKAAMLVVLTKPGHAKPLVFECLGNEVHGLRMTRACVGIDDAVFVSAVYGQTTPLYLTFAALWQDELRTAGISHGDNHIDEESLEQYRIARLNHALDSTGVGLTWGEARRYATSHDMHLAHALQDLVDSRVEPEVMEYVMEALQEMDTHAYSSFLQRSADWVKS